MFFNALLKDIGICNIEQFKKDCHLLFESSSEKYYFPKIQEFNDSKWALIELSYEKADKMNRYYQPTKSYYDIIDQIFKLVGNNYYVVSSMIAWLLPGQSIDKHVDLQKVYANTRRIHVQISQDSESYMSVWAGSIEYKVNIKPGQIYELNNRVYHAVRHNGSKEIYSILVIDIAEKNSLFNVEDNVIKDYNLPDSNNLKLWI